MSNPLPRLDTSLVIDLIKWAEVSEGIENDPRFAGWGVWDQSEWGRGEVRPDSEGGVCGTAYCMAGQAVTQAGYRLVFPNWQLSTADFGDTLSAHHCIPRVPTGVLDDRGQMIWEDAGEAVNISEKAQEIIGLTDEEADYFFSGSNSINTLKQYANLFFAARGEPIPYPDTTNTTGYDPTDEDTREDAEEFYDEGNYETHFFWRESGAV